MLLFRLVFVLAFALVAWLVHAIFHTGWYSLLYVSIGGLLLSYLLTLIAGSASRGVALRPVTAQPRETVPDPSSSLPNSQRWYIESLSPDKGLPYSCSFVEFDERGDYLDFAQHRHVYEKVMALAKNHEHLVVVIFLHGWRNNGQSGNVIDFNEFLHQLATDTDRESERVHGIYLSWRGACLKHGIRPDEKPFQDVAERYGGPIVDLRYAARFPALNELLETFSYFDRKGVPEHLTSGTALSRTIMTCARVAKRFQPTSHVFLIGHSFGGLMVERTFQNATIGELVMSWPFRKEKPETQPQPQANPLPFDTVLLVNSAAPSIYARQFQSLLAAHGAAMSRYEVVGANSPVFFSLTSAGDWATGRTHPLANSLCFLLPTLRRKYRGDDFILADSDRSGDVLIQQSYYYRHTPGHNPLLVNRFIEPAKAPSSTAATPAINHLRENLLYAGDTLAFTTSPQRKGEPTRHWRVNFPPESETFKEFSQYTAGGRTYRPVAWEVKSGVYVYKDTPYWIIRCPKEIIKDHNDIWSQQAMDTYAALYAIALKLREKKPPSALHQSQR